MQLLPLQIAKNRKNRKNRYVGFLKLPDFNAAQAAIDVMTGKKVGVYRLDVKLSRSNPNWIPNAARHYSNQINTVRGNNQPVWNYKQQFYTQQCQQV